MGLSQRKAAAALGMTHTGLKRALDSGRVSVEEDGTYDVEKCRKSLAEKTDARLQRRRVKRPAAATVDQVEPPQVSTIAVEVSTDLVSDTSGPFQEAQRRREWLRVQREEIELAARRGELVKIADVEKVWARIVSGFRSRLLAIPTRAAQAAMTASTLQAARAAIEVPLYEALDELSAGGLPVDTNSGDGGGNPGSLPGDHASEVAAETHPKRVGRPKKKA